MSRLSRLVRKNNQTIRDFGAPLIQPILSTVRAAGPRSSDLEKAVGATDKEKARAERQAPVYRLAGVVVGGAVAAGAMTGGSAATAAAPAAAKTAAVAKVGTAAKIGTAAKTVLGGTIISRLLTGAQGALLNLVSPGQEAAAAPERMDLTQATETAWDPAAGGGSMGSIFSSWGALAVAGVLLLVAVFWPTSRKRAG